MSGIDMSAIGAQLAKASASLEKLSATDLTDPENAFALQQGMATYQELYGIISAMVADYKSIVTSMIQKM
ncbi:MAG: hypothetical protein H6953_12385 [Chromatiaceae bacterium]|nr:hypothetical protein [Chromatiaceae bacterium]MCP5315853.1 hypothetical protein [Chromatiaceae bacterium]